MSGGNIKVVVRCRPLNARELARGAKCLIRMENNQTILDPPEPSGSSSRSIEKKPHVYSFDRSFWSAGPRNEPKYASQYTIYEDLGVELLDHSFEGFNTCIFAYGQTGSGKSYSMMGYGADKGIIPLTTSELFRRVEERAEPDPNLTFSVEVSYMEIYNEKVRDLLNPKNKGNLKVREHPSLGPYVEDLSRLAVENYSQMMTLMDEGNKARTVASTNMNETSSRSHAVFTLILTQKRLDTKTNMTGEKVSKISLVDLAGSERQASTGATGTRLKEGANINKSLTTLGQVIAALAHANKDRGIGRKKKDEFVPYRDSVLTWLLKESLGGNSKTAMIAAISPADYEETLSTLRYANAAKRIKTHAVINEDPNEKLIRALKEELEMLRGRVTAGFGADESTFDPSIPPEKQMVTYRTKEGEIKTVTKLELQDQLQASEKLMESLNLTWEEKMAKTQVIQVEREKALEELGITVDKNMVGVHAPQKHPSLVNLNEDPLMSECLVYQLKPGATMTGSVDSPKAHIKLSGDKIMEEHCVFVNIDGEVTIEAMAEARTFVNGQRVPPNLPIKLLNGFRVILGDFHVFRFNDPAFVRAQRSKTPGSTSNSDLFTDSGTPSIRADSPGVRVDAELMDWSAARREVTDIDKLGDHDLERLFDDIVKVRSQRKRPDSRFLMRTDVDARSLFIAPDDSFDSLELQATITADSRSAPLATEGDAAIEADGHPTAPQDLSGTMPRLEQVEHMGLEQQTLTKQLQSLAREFKRIRSQAAVERAKGEVLPDVAMWSTQELLQARKAANQWKRLRQYTMTEQVLTRAVDVREANIIAKQMERGVAYNFMVSGNSSVSPKSSLDDLSGLVDFDDIVGLSAESKGPCVMIRVVDRESLAVYSWDMIRFEHQLQRMRQVLGVKDRPNYSVHLRVDAPFADLPSPNFSYIGDAQVPLRLLAHQLSYSVTVPIFCPYTFQAIGSCRVGFACAPMINSGVATPKSNDLTPAIRSAPFGDKFSFTLTVDMVRGFSSVDYTAVHAQVRLSSLVGTGLASEDTFASLPVDLNLASVAQLALRRTITVLVTYDMIEHLTTGYASVEFFARTRLAYLERLEKFDHLKEVSPVASRDESPTPSRDERQPMRRAETDFVAAEHHDILVNMEILELAVDGEYAAVEVVDDTFLLHQGVQRHISLTLVHSSGRAFPWTKVVHASSGEVRIATKVGEVQTASAGEVDLRLVSQVEVLTDGTSRLQARGTWDTAAHHCTYLDRRTPSEQHVVIRLMVMIAIGSTDEPAVLSFDFKLKILGRDAKRSSLLSLWRPKPVNSVVLIFGVDLAPALARTAKDLLRLDTAKRPLPGEQIIAGWKPRSISLVHDYATFTRVRRIKADVQATRAILEHMGDLPRVYIDARKKFDLLSRCIELWQSEMDTRLELHIQYETPAEEALTRKLHRLVPDLGPRLVPTVHLVAPSESVIKRGQLRLLKDSQSNQWIESHAVLRRPYIHLHPEIGRPETQLINVEKATVKASPDVEMLLGRRFAFTIFTPTNSYIIQATSQRELDEWMMLIGSLGG